MRIHNKQIIVITSIFISIVLCLYYFQDYYSIHKKKHYTINHPNDDTLRITFIGDSWAFYHQGHPCTIKSQLSDSLSINISVISAGICGATSKVIYSSFFSHSSIQKALRTGPDYCILAIGLNDSNLKLGQRFYQQHTKRIIDFLLQNNIIPIVIEIPDYDIEKLYRESTIMQKIRRRISMAITGNNLDCREENRQALNTIIKQNNYASDIIIIKKDQWNPSGYKDIRQLYQPDGIHLNNRGYTILDSIIAQAIMMDYKNRKAI